MTALGFSLALAAVLLGTGAQLLLKSGTNVVGPFAFTLENAVPVGLRLAFEPHIAGGVMCYAVSLVLWILALSRSDVSVVYPMVSIGFALNAALAWWLLGEPVTPQRLLGIGVIILGVVLVARS
ncbi:MAG: 4-amino-4-deoxy-L-arabinose transferase [Betaproteobacteria bacterium]|nr:MAG: 4-amino-4-deoxy-L-arabinose transferase [Betaproteobacteria bacterium]